MTFQYPCSWFFSAFWKWRPWASLQALFLVEGNWGPSFGVGVAHPFFFLNHIKIEFGVFWLFVTLLAFPRASERCQRYILFQVDYHVHLGTPTSHLMWSCRGPDIVQGQLCSPAPFPCKSSLVLTEVFRALKPQLLRGQRIRWCSNWHFAPCPF